MAAKASILHPSNETESSSSRITKEGKKLTYSLRIVQQPERARACGAGAKASADRRPIDPPPVVELRIFESDLNDMNKTDITFSYNANFFLFTTLEWARPIAHGRVQGQSSPTPPVLTGVPVAGVAYLDRPAPAGYFIFPDLSVRHEGLYRLNFSLYEEVKDPKDEDKDAPSRPRPIRSLPSLAGPLRETDEHIFFRLDVVTASFTVFSAKKFPGLSESTSLSRIVAEQGCRVRIRRDVRMRRREPKAGKDYGYDERHMTPDNFPSTPVERPRSTSNASVEPPYGYCPTPQRVPSAQGFAYTQGPYQPPAPVALPPGPSPSAGPQSHLAFGAAQSQYCTPQMNMPPATPQPAPPAAYPSPLTGYTHHRQISTGSEYEQPLQRFPESSAQRPQLEKAEAAKASLPPIAVPAAPVNGRSYDYRSSDPKDYHSTPQMPPPAQPPRTPVSTAQPPLVPVDPDIPAGPSPASNLVNASYDPGRGKGWAYESEPVLSKRSHGDVFGSSQQNRPLYHGERPDAVPERESTSGTRVDLPNPTDTGRRRLDPMLYRRADGRTVSRLTGPAR